MVLTPTRWKLRRAVALLNRIFTTLGLEKDPNKTFIGRVEKGFDFLGYHLWPDRITVAQATVERFLARSDKFRLEVGNLAEEVGPVVAHGISPLEGTARMGRLLALVVGREAVRERFKIVAVDGVRQTLIHRHWLCHRPSPASP